MAQPNVLVEVACTERAKRVEVWVGKSPRTIRFEGKRNNNAITVCDQAVFAFNRFKSFTRVVVHTRERSPAPFGAGHGFSLAVYHQKDDF